MKELVSIDFLKIVIPLIGAIIAWFLNERSKRTWEEYKRKEENYKDLIKAIKGFYQSHDEKTKKDLKNVFIDQLNLCWLYSPDVVIQKGYNFINTIMLEKSTDEKKENSLGEFILAIRKDLMGTGILSKTKLKGSDFKNLTST